MEVIGHRAGAGILDAEARRPWSHRYLRDEVAADPRLGPSFTARAEAMATFDGFAVVRPHTEFDDALTLPDGVEVRHVGGRHAGDSTVVAVPDSGVLLLGDCFCPPPLHLRQPGDTYDWGVIRSLLDGPGFDWYVDSHSDPRTAREVRELVQAGPAA